jgi:hypothetical protein
VPDRRRHDATKTASRGGFGFGFRRQRFAVGFGFDGGGFGFVAGFGLNGGGFGSAMGLGLRWVSALIVGGLVCGGFNGSFDGWIDFVVVLWLWWWFNSLYVVGMFGFVLPAWSMVGKWEKKN